MKGVTEASGPDRGVEEWTSSGAVEAAWCVVEATTGRTEALAGVAAEARRSRRLSDRAATAETGVGLGPLGVEVRLRRCVAPWEAGEGLPAVHHGALSAGWSATGSGVDVDSARETATRGDRADGAEGAKGLSTAWERRLRRLSGRG